MRELLHIVNNQGYKWVYKYSIGVQQVAQADNSLMKEVANRTNWAMCSKLNPSASIVSRVEWMLWLDSSNVDSTSGRQCQGRNGHKHQTH